MWLPMLLLAVMASGSACPDFCQCRSPVIECRGHAPKLTQLDELSPSFTELKIRNVEQEEFRPYIAATPNSTFLRRLQAIEVTNCSTLINQHFLRWDVPRGGDSSSPVLPNVRSLNISHNKLTSIPDRCSLFKENLISQLRVFDAGHNQIDSVALNYCRHMFQLTWLSLAGNNLHFIGPNNLRYLKSLEYLDLSDNALQTLDKIFDSLASLQRLNVAGNKLEHVQANWFQNLGKLFELDVSRNKLTFVSADALRPLSSLSVLKLAENPLIERDLSLLLCTGRRLETVDASRLGLVRIPAALTRSVKILKLVGNQLTSIYSGDLDSYPLLKLLDLSDNRLMIIEDDALGRLDSLEELILSGNILLAVPKSLPSGLLELDLRQNAISKLRANDLQGLFALRELYLSGNVISGIEEGSFHQMPALRLLDISDNPIKKLPSDTLSGPTNLISLRMSGLMWLETEEDQNRDTAFPFLTPERLVTVDISRSPALCAQLLADNAVLSACKSLQELDLSYTNISALRSDLAYVLPQLRTLKLIGNEWNCTEDQYWLGEWMRQHGASASYSTRCAAPSELEGKLLEEMPSMPSGEGAEKIAKVERSTATASARPTNYSPAVTEMLDLPGQSMTNDEPKESWRPFNLPQDPRKTTSNSSHDSRATKSFSSTSQASNTLERSSTTSAPITPTQSSSMKSRDSRDEAVTSVPSSLTFEPRDSIGSEEEGWSRNSIATAKYASKMTTPEESPDIEPQSTAPIDLIESNQDEQSISTSTARPAPTTNENRRPATGITMVTPISPENKRRTTNRASTGTTMTSGSTAKLSNDKIQEILTNGHQDIKTDPKTLHPKTSTNAITEFSRSKLLLSREEARANDDEAGSFAAKLNSQATESGARTSETLGNGAHPGMLVLLGAAIGAAAALTVVLSRRATVKRRDRQYHRHENIEVHALTPTTELW